LELALELANATRPDEAVYVGDALDDMRMAAAVGVRGVGIVSMLADAEELGAAGAVESAASVVEWVERFLGDLDADAPKHRDPHAANRRPPAP
jgi:phosphoglycolate phosphatase-like HAD superfamily hydrolase